MQIFPFASAGLVRATIPSINPINAGIIDQQKIRYRIPEPVFPA